MTRYGSSTGRETRRGGAGDRPTAQTRPSINGAAVFLDDREPRHYTDLKLRCRDCGYLAVILLDDGCHPSCGHEARAIRNGVNKALALGTLRSTARVVGVDL